MYSSFIINMNLIVGVHRYLIKIAASNAIVPLMKRHG